MEAEKTQWKETHKTSIIKWFMDGNEQRKNRCDNGSQRGMNGFSFLILWIRSRRPFWQYELIFLVENDQVKKNNVFLIETDNKVSFETKKNNKNQSEGRILFSLVKKRFETSWKAFF